MRALPRVLLTEGRQRVGLDAEGCPALDEQQGPNLTGDDPWMPAELGDVLTPTFEALVLRLDEEIGMADNRVHTALVEHERKLEAYVDAYVADVNEACDALAAARRETSEARAEVNRLRLDLDATNSDRIVSLAALRDERDAAQGMARDLRAELDAARQAGLPTAGHVARLAALEELAAAMLARAEGQRGWIDGSLMARINDRVDRATSALRDAPQAQAGSDR